MDNLAAQEKAEKLQNTPTSFRSTGTSAASRKVTCFSDFGGAGRKLPVSFRAIAVKLNMRQMHTHTFNGLNGIQRCFQVAWNTKVASVHM